MGDERLPLAGRRVVITRAREQARELAELLQQLGAEVVFVPLIQFAEVEDLGALRSVVSRLPEFDWLLFTSPNAVRFFIKACLKLGAILEFAEAGRPQVAAVGPASARALMDEGIPVAHVAADHRAAALAEELKGRLRGSSVLLPRSDAADGALPDALRSASARVTEVTCYRNLQVAVDPVTLQQMHAGEIDVIAFASPSAFRSFLAQFGAPERRAAGRSVALAALGESTRAAIEAEGLAVQIVSPDATMRDFAGAIADYFQRPIGVSPS